LEKIVEDKHTRSISACRSFYCNEITGRWWYRRIYWCWKGL